MKISSNIQDYRNKRYLLAHFSACLFRASRSVAPMAFRGSIFQELEKFESFGVHSDERPFVCSYDCCGKASAIFKRQCDLKRHVDYLAPLIPKVPYRLSKTVTQASQ